MRVEPQNFSRKLHRRWKQSRQSAFGGAIYSFRAHVPHEPHHVRQSATFLLVPIEYICECSTAFREKIYFSPELFKRVSRSFRGQINTNLEGQITSNFFVGVHIHPVALAGEVGSPELN